MYPLITQLYVPPHCSSMCIPSLLRFVCSCVSPHCSTICIPLITQLCVHPRITQLCVYLPLISYVYTLNCSAMCSPPHSQAMCSSAVYVLPHCSAVCTPHCTAVCTPSLLSYVYAPSLLNSVHPQSSLLSCVCIPSLLNVQL